MNDMINTILIVEDDIVFCKMLTRFLVKKGYAVSDAQSAAGAHSYLEQKNFDLAILDYKLPDGSGIEILKKINVVISFTPFSV
jgi:DNA-binding response OmpR family regulator